MKIQLESYNDIADQLKKQFPKFTDFERLSLAIQIERNQILENGLGLDKNEPSYLEAIAMSLGVSDNQFSKTITEVLKDIRDKE